MRFTGGCETDKGEFRQNNEDAIILRTANIECGNLIVGAVCDGIGGLECGELASRFVADKVSDWFEWITSWFDPEKNRPELLFSHLQDGAEVWNSELIDTMLGEGVRMGTTMSVIMAVNEHIFILHVGDSRIYRYNPKSGLSLLTTDASVTKMSNGRMRSFLDNFMGKSDELWFSLSELKADDNDMFLYCSDGFYHTFSDADAEYYHRCLAEGKDPNKICIEAIQNAIRRGERDNISVGMLYVSKKHKKNKLFGI